MWRAFGIWSGCRSALAAACLLAWALPANAVGLIRDAETETVISSIAKPIFTAARLDPDSIDIYMLNDPTLNAFVAGGQNLFINTGLIMRTEGPDQLAGVIAHETGHIAGGHLSRTMEAQKNAGFSTLAGALLGAAAAVAGAPQLATAFMAGGATVGQQNFLKFSRIQEEAADQAAVTYLKALQMSPEGLLEFFHVLETQNLRISADGNEFLRTHPLTSSRIAFLEEKVAESPYRTAKPNPQLMAAYARVVAKLDGFLSDPTQVLQKRASDSVPDRYARAVAYYRIPDIPKALALVDGLIADVPKDPYFYEFKGQILFENGRVNEAIPPYRDALRYRPNSALIRLGLARALMEIRTRQGPTEAAAMLREVVTDRAQQWRRLALSRHRRRPSGQRGRRRRWPWRSRRCSCGNRKDAQLYLHRAEQFVQPGRPRLDQAAGPLPCRRRHRGATAAAAVRRVVTGAAGRSGLDAPVSLPSRSVPVIVANLPSPPRMAAGALVRLPAHRPRPPSPLPVAEIEKIVREYLLREPEVIYQAIQELQKRQQAGRGGAAAGRRSPSTPTRSSGTPTTRSSGNAGRQCHPGRVLRLPLRLLPQRWSATARPGRAATAAALRVQGAAGARARFGDRGQGGAGRVQARRQPSTTTSTWP